MLTQIEQPVAVQADQQLRRDPRARRPRRRRDRPHAARRHRRPRDRPHAAAGLPVRGLQPGADLPRRRGLADPRRCSTRATRCRARCRRWSTTRSATTSSRSWAGRPASTAACRPESTAPPSGTQLTVATYNVENLDPGDGARLRRDRPPDHRQPPRSRRGRGARGAGQQRARRRAAARTPTSRSRAWSTRSTTWGRATRTGRSTRPTTRTAASRAGTSASASCSGPERVSFVDRGAARPRRPPPTTTRPCRAPS